MRICNFKKYGFILMLVSERTSDLIFLVGYARGFKQYYPKAESLQDDEIVLIRAERFTYIPKKQLTDEMIERIILSIFRFDCILYRESDLSIQEMGNDFFIGAWNKGPMKDAILEYNVYKIGNKLLNENM